jgi:hypothetical protein
MKPVRKRSHPGIPVSLLAAISDEFQESSFSYILFSEFLENQTYTAEFAGRLINSAKSTDLAWEVRRLAILMLEHQLLRIPVANIDEHDAILVRLGMKAARGANVEMNASVLKEGYTSRDLRRFVPELRRRLERLNPLHARMNGRKTSKAAMLDFVHLSRRDCKLTLARYLFRPEEVVARILEQVRVTRGAPDMEPGNPVYIPEEVERTLNRLPDYEAQIIDQLIRRPMIYWVSSSTSSEINSLVEYPLMTIVLVFKLPGSDVEVELKRAGHRGRHPLSVVFSRGGVEVPAPHRLDGGSMRWLLRHEERSSSLLATLYRLIHSEEPPMSRIINRTIIHGVPGEESEFNILDYYSRSAVFGPGFDEMHEAMRQCVRDYNGSDKPTALDQAGNLGLTVQFINNVVPGQAVLVGTSSFRLCRMATYLSEKGPDIYFSRTLKVHYTFEDARRFADELLEEILGVYYPPGCQCESYVQYLDAAFSVPENRKRADQIYASLLQQIGKFWGTLLGLRGYSWGESFVARNVGLKSYWSNGEWKVKVIFMDHDNLHLIQKEQRHFEPDGALPGMCTDARYIGGDLAESGPGISEFHFLEELYRPARSLRRTGKAMFRRAMKRAYVRTHDRIINDPTFHRYFNKAFIERLKDWDWVAKGFLAVAGDSAAVDQWKEETTKRLTEKGYTNNMVKSYFRGIDDHTDFVKNLSFLS